MTCPFGNNVQGEQNDSILVPEPGQTTVDRLFRRAGHVQLQRADIIQTPSALGVPDCIAIDVGRRASVSYTRPQTVTLSLPSVEGRRTVRSPQQTKSQTSCPNFLFSLNLILMGS